MILGLEQILLSFPVNYHVYACLRHQMVNNLESIAKLRLTPIPGNFVHNQLQATLKMACTCRFPPKWVTFFRLQVCEKVRISLVIVTWLENLSLRLWKDLKGLTARIYWLWRREENFLLLLCIHVMEKTVRFNTAVKKNVKRDELL